MLDYISADPSLNVGQLADDFDVSRIAVMNHLGVLEKAKLVTSEKDGRCRRLYLNAMPIQDIHERWIDSYAAHWAERVNTIKYVAEAAARKLERRDDND